MTGIDDDPQAPREQHDATLGSPRSSHVPDAAALGRARADEGAVPHDDAADERPLLGERSLTQRLFIWGGPLGFFIAIMTSLWVSHWHVRSSAVVHVETSWRPHEQLAIRAQMVSEELEPIVRAAGRAWVEQGDQTVALATLEGVADAGVVQAVFGVPELALGPATLHVELEAPDRQPLHEQLEVTLVEQRAIREPATLVAGSALQYANDTDPQPSAYRIDLRPRGRLVSGFPSALFVRTLAADGTPLAASVEVALVDGEFDGLRGRRSSPPIVAAGRTDSNGLFEFGGLLLSEMVGFEVRLASETSESWAAHRKVRLVSFAGSTMIATSLSLARPGETLAVETRTLSHRRTLYVDVFGPDGAFVDTFVPPVTGVEPPREYRIPQLGPGVLQFEAHQSLQKASEATASDRVQLVVDALDPVDALVAAHREAINVARVEAGFDANIEAAYLNRLAERPRSADTDARLHRFLLGTLPAGAFGPPTALVTHTREHEILRAKQRRWTVAVRIALLGGGGVFLLALTWSMIRAHAAAARSTLAAWQGLAADPGELQAAVNAAKREALVRGLAVVFVMLGALILTTIMLESFFWVF